MFTASPQQAAAAEALQRYDEVRTDTPDELKDRSRQLRDFISQIIELAENGTAYSVWGGKERKLTDRPYTRNDARLRLWEKGTESFVASLPTAADSPQMGMQTEIFRTGVVKESVLGGPYNTVGVVTAADINVGVIHNETSRSQVLVGAQTIIRATVHPPAVYFRDGVDTPLTEVEPGTAMWDAAQDFISTAEVNKEALRGHIAAASNPASVVI